MRRQRSEFDTRERRARFAACTRGLIAVAAAAALILVEGTQIASAQFRGGGFGGGGFGGPGFAGRFRGPPRPLPPGPVGPGRGHAPIPVGYGVPVPAGGGGAADGSDGAPARHRIAPHAVHHARHPHPVVAHRQEPSHARRLGNGTPPYVADEVVTRLATGAQPGAVDALARRYRLVMLERQTLQLTGDSLVRWRIPRGRSVAQMMRALGGDGRVAAVQPNYLFSLQQQAAQEGDAAQYALSKLHLPQAHQLAKGAGVLVAVVDSGIEAGNAELAGSIAEAFDAVGGSAGTDPHGTEIAGVIVAHGELMGAAPGARLLAVRAFAAGAPRGAATGTTFAILKGIDWAALHGARVVNLSFAGPADPELGRELGAASGKGIVLVAAAGNAGAQSPPLYPAADPHVLAVTATDDHDHLFAAANRGRHVAMAAPGVDILVPAPHGGYQVASGTSFAAAFVSGIAALLVERRSTITPDALRTALTSTAGALVLSGGSDQAGAGLADAYRAVQAVEATATNADAPR